MSKTKHVKFDKAARRRLDDVVRSPAAQQNDAVAPEFVAPT
jgi:hypothetical protein